MIIEGNIREGETVEVSVKEKQFQIKKV